MSKKTPMIEQYLEIKKQYQDCILFFRLGDFYEMFFEDAIIASRDLEIVLTGRDSGEERIPMCGVPFHSVSGYLSKLLSKGHKVAICEQVEDPKAVKGIVKREVVRVITPGTVIEEQLLNEKTNNYLLAITSTNQSLGLAHVDISTSEFRATQIGKNQLPLLSAEIIRIRPAEIYLAAAVEKELSAVLSFEQSTVSIGEEHFFHYDNAYECLKEHFKLSNLHSFGLEGMEAATIAAGAILQYLQETQKNSLLHLRKINTYQIGDFMALDPATRRNLELTRTARSNEIQGSLLGVLDLTVTAMGSRKLRNWIEQPLTNLDAINERQAAIADLTHSLEVRETLRESLKKTYDLQRILSKLSSNSANARDLLALRNTLNEIPLIKEVIAQFQSRRISKLQQALNPLSELASLLNEALVDDPPLSIKEGGMIKGTFNSELQKLIAANSEGKRWVAELEQTERERTGIKSLKVGYNQVFGYYIEVTKSNLNLIPADYIRKQTLANCERYINQQLKEYEDLILNAHEKSAALEYQIFQEIKDEVLKAIDILLENAQILAELDVFLSLAEVAVRYHYNCPEMVTNGVLRIIEGRHPVVERMLPSGSFVPNDTIMDLDDNRTQIITGPNMAGKSTYMRQVALLVLMAHIGSYIPAKSAQISLVDRIFTRVGASDDLATGQSTFMVEMNEVAYILNHATKDSFIILDEIGRGTSTFDGLSIAWAVIEFINNQNRIGAKTLVATHYHELTELENRLAGVKNYHVAVKRENNEISFLRKIIPGSAAQSYGIEVAALAGLPSEIIDRSREILVTLEKNEVLEFKMINKEKAPPQVQLPLFPLVQSDILNEIKTINLIALTPLEALNRIYEWQQKLQKDGAQ